METISILPTHHNKNVRYSQMGGTLQPFQDNLIEEIQITGTPSLL